MQEPCGRSPNRLYYSAIPRLHLIYDGSLQSLGSSPYFETAMHASMQTTLKPQPTPSTDRSCDMSQHPFNDQLVQWHMSQLRNWMMPTSTPSSAPPPPPASQQQVLNTQTIPCQQSVYNVQPPYVYNSFQTYIPSQPQRPTIFPRAQTFADFSNFDYDYNNPATPMSAALEEVPPFDDYDAGSCYSGTPSSYISSDVTDRSSCDAVFPATTRHSHFITSQPAPRSQHAPPSEVDALMRSIQPTTSPASACGSSPDCTIPAPERPKKHLCPYKECNKSFSQPTHLKIHLRSHTGEKPYTCSVSTCRQTFSQLGNLRTHERRHVGQRPNRKRSCSDPGSRTKRYECILDGCGTRSTNTHGVAVRSGKVFTQLGNLKAHMNKFHKETLARLSDQFATQSEEDEQLKEYFKSLFKNSNKGIKGRGKGRRVEVLVSDPPYQSEAA